MSFIEGQYSRLLDEIRIVQKKFLRNFTDFGLKISLKRSATLFLKPIFYKQGLIIYEINMLSFQSRKFNKRELFFKPLTVKDTVFINQIEDMSEWLKGKLENKLKTNGICMAIIKNNNVVGFNLASIGECYLPLLKLRVKTKTNEAWSDQISIHKDYRRKGLASELRNRFYRELKKYGIKALYGHRLEFNIASQRSARKYTSEEMVKAEYLRILGREKVRFVKIQSYRFDTKLEAGKKNTKEKTKKEWHHLKPRKGFEYPFSIDVAVFKD